MDKIIDLLKKILPGEYSWWPNEAKYSYHISWVGRENSSVEKQSSCEIDSKDLINYKDAIELAYMVRDKLLHQVYEVNSDLVMDMITGKV